MLRLTPLGQPGLVSAARERGLQSKPGSTFMPSLLPAHAPAFLYTTSCVPSLIVCLTLPGLLKQNAGIFFYFLLSIHKATVLYWGYIKLLKPHLHLMSLYVCWVDQIAIKAKCNQETMKTTYSTVVPPQAPLRPECHWIGLVSRMITLMWFDFSHNFLMTLNKGILA